MKKLLVLLAAVVLGATGCTEVPDPPATPAATSHAYTSDLENTVALAVRRGNNDEDLMQQIDLVAQRHDLDDWMSRDDSFTAIGKGLRYAQVDEAQAIMVAEAVSGRDEGRRQLVLQAYGN